MFIFWFVVGTSWILFCLFCLFLALWQHEWRLRYDLKKELDHTRFTKIHSELQKIRKALERAEVSREE